MRSRLKRKFENLIENTWYGPEKKKLYQDTLTRNEEYTLCLTCLGFHLFMQFLNSSTKPFYFPGKKTNVSQLHL